MTKRIKVLLNITIIITIIIILSYFLYEHIVLAEWILGICILIYIFANQIIRFLLGNSIVLFYMLVTGILSYIVIKIFINKNLKNNKRKELKLLNLFFLAFLLCILVLGTAERHVFTYDKWLEKVESRKYMINNMIDKTDLINLKKDKVVSILGQPDDENKRNDKHYIVYFIGYMAIDDDQLYLVIEFDENEKVKDYEVNPYGSI